MIQGTSTALHPVLILMAGIIGAVSLPGNAPSAGTVQPGTTDDFSAAYATPQDIVEGNRLAEASCARCHGANGISTAKGVPHLASQRPVYLHLELLAYKSGARGNDMMDGAVKFLSDDALVKVAAYYASLDPPQPAPTATTAAAPREARSGQRRESSRGRLRGMPWRDGRQQDPRHAQPRRAGARVPGRGHEGLQGRSTRA